MKFNFAIPKAPKGLSKPVQRAIELAAIAGKLAVEERTIVFNTDGRAENVAEHSNMLAIVAPNLAAEFFPKLDANLVARYAPIHDLLEAYVGDTPTHIISDEELANKSTREAAALERIKLEYAHVPSFLARIVEYEDQTVPETRFVRMVDKLMPLLVHMNDSYAGLSKAGYTAEAILQNSAERASAFLRDYPDMAHIIEMRVELAAYVAGQLEIG